MSGAIVHGTLTGETAHFATGITVGGFSSFNGIHVDNSTTNPICFKRNGSIVTQMYGPTSGGGSIANVFLPGKSGTLALTSDIPTGGGGTTITADGVVKTAMNASSTGGIKTLVMTDKLGHFGVTGGIGSLFVDSELFTASETTEKNYRTEIVSTGIRFCSDAHTPPDLDEGSWLTLHGPTAISGGSFSHTIYLPQKSGTVALLSDITGGGSAGVSSIGGKTGAITLGTGLSMNGNELSAEDGGGTTYYQHLLRSKYTDVCDYQFYMTVISTQSSEAGGLTELVLNSANITVGIDVAQSGAPQDYAGFVPAIMIENPDGPANSTIFFVDTINNMRYAIAAEDTEFISDSVETL